MCGESVLWTEWMHTNECPVTFQNEKLSSRDVYSAKPHTHTQTLGSNIDIEDLFSASGERARARERGRRALIHCLSSLYNTYLCQRHLFGSRALDSYNIHKRCNMHITKEINQSMQEMSSSPVRFFSAFGQSSPFSHSLCHAHTQHSDVCMGNVVVSVII